MSLVIPVVAVVQMAEATTPEVGEKRRQFSHKKKLEILKYYYENGSNRSLGSIRSPCIGGLQRERAVG